MSNQKTFKFYKSPTIITDRVKWYHNAILQNNDVKKENNYEEENERMKNRIKQRKALPQMS